MLPTFVIGLREGLEAALIVSIVTTFLVQRGRRDLVRWVFAGVGVAVVLCTAVGIALDVVSRNLPQRQQEGLETVIGLVAVGMVTYMVVWMRRHSRNLKGQLEGATAEALAAGSGFALVAMAFLAVFREGFETAVFLLAAFNESTSGASAGVGASLGILVAIALGYGIYRGGVRLNLSRFFRATGLVLVLVAAGLVVNAAHTAHEAGWLDAGQSQFADLSAVVRPGSVRSSLLTGILGIQERPTVVEFLAWLTYLVPVGLYVAWPPGRALAARTRLRLYAGTLAGGLIAGAALIAAGTASGSAADVTTTFAGTSVRVLDRGGDRADLLLSGSGGQRRVSADRTDAQVIAGRRAIGYQTVSTQPANGAARTMTLGEIAQANGGRLPLGVAASDTDFGTAVPVTVSDELAYTFWIDPGTDVVISAQTSTRRSITARLAVGTTAVGDASPRTTAATPAEVAAATRSARNAETSGTRGQAATVTGVYLVLLAALAGLRLPAARARARKLRNTSPSVSEPARDRLASPN